MSTPAHSPAAPTDSFADHSREAVRRRYLAACESSRGSGAPPDLDSFLAAMPEPDRSELRAELVAATTEMYGKSAETVDSVSSPLAATPTDTADFVRAPASGQGQTEPTIDQPSPQVAGTIDQVASASGPSSEVASRASAKRSMPIPKEVAGYEVLRVLGRGAMGVVYQARQRGLKRIVALKMILSGAHASENDLIRFRSEAEAVAQLQHPGIVQLYEVGEEDGQPYFSLEFVDGESLARKIDGTPQPPREAARLVLEMARAMDYAHLHGVIHRDLKPANVLLTTEGMPKITDFGLAKRLEDDSGHTRSGSILGTPSYMSPEQAEGGSRDVGPLADLYSLGAILYELLTGRAPFRGASIMETLEQVRTHEPVPPTQLQPAVPRDLETICLKCLQKDAAKRYAGAGALAEDLRRYLAGEPITARPVSRGERLVRWCRRNPRVAGMIGAMVAIGVLWILTSTVLAGIAMANEKEAKRQTGIAEKYAEEATKQTKIARAKKIEAEENAREADKQAGIAKEEARIAVENETRARDTGQGALHEMVEMAGRIYDRLQSKKLTSQGNQEVRKAREDVIAMLRRSLGDVNNRFAKAKTSTFVGPATLTKLGNLFARLGQVEEAQRAYRAAFDLMEKEVQAHPDDDQARANFAVTYLFVGDILLELDGDAQAARKLYLQARTLDEEILKQPRGKNRTADDQKRSLSHDEVHVGRALLLLGDPKAARASLERSLAYRQEWANAVPTKGVRSFLVEVRMYLGTAAAHLGDKKGVGDHFGEAIAIGKENVLDLKDYSFKVDLAVASGLQADAQLRLADYAAAKESAQLAMKNLELVLAHSPDDVSLLPFLALTHEQLAMAGSKLDKFSEADKHWKEALKLRTELLEIEPGNLVRQAARLLAMARCGQHAEASKAAMKLRPSVSRSSELMLQLARCHAQCAIHDPEKLEMHVEAALDLLRAATGGEFRAPVVLTTDPDLEPLRDDPGFKKLVAQIQAR